MKILFFCLEIACSNTFCFFYLLEKDTSKKTMDFREFKCTLILRMGPRAPNSSEESNDAAASADDTPEEQRNDNSAAKRDEVIHFLLRFELDEALKKTVRKICHSFCSCGVSKLTTFGCYRCERAFYVACHSKHLNPQHCVEEEKEKILSLKSKEPEVNDYVPSKKMEFVEDGFCLRMMDVSFGLISC